jgi:hypothetical protein
MCVMRMRVQPQDRVEARWTHDSAWYPAHVDEKLADGRYRISWHPHQPDDREKSASDLRRIVLAAPRGGCTVS